ncbi:MAG: LolA-related protein [Rhodoferax sp.]
MTLLNPTLTRTLVAALLTLAAGVAAAGDVKLSELMQLLAQQKSGKASFVEKKYIGIVDKPVESSGELAFIAPSKLEKRTLKPTLESLVLDGDSLTIEQADRRRLTVSLQEHPEVSAFVESIRGTLAGDRTALEKYYTINATGPMEKWQLQLVPTQARMAQVISRIRISGAQASVKTIEFEQADGDRSEMFITGMAAK